MGIALITGCFAILGTLCGAYFTYKFQERQNTKAKKQLLISELDGLKIWREQLYLSRFFSGHFLLIYYILYILSVAHNRVSGVSSIKRTI